MAQESGYIPKYINKCNTLEGGSWTSNSNEQFWINRCLGKNNGQWIPWSLHKGKF